MWHRLRTVRVRVLLPRDYSLWQRKGFQKIVKRNIVNLMEGFDAVCYEVFTARFYAALVNGNYFHLWRRPSKLGP